VVCAIAKEPIENIVKDIWPFLLGQIVTLLIVTFVPLLSLIIPSMLGYH
jgi:TRAP-type C4-dicarboxylate transport system permease large subunit